MSAPGFWRNARQQYWSGQAVGLPFAGNTYYVGSGAPPGVGIRRVDTIQAAASLMIERDVLIIGPGEYDENVTLTNVNKATIIGAGGPDSVRITALTNGRALTIDGCQDLNIVNLNLEGRGTGGALRLTGQIRRLHADFCRFHGGDTGILVDPAAGGQIVDAYITNSIIALLTTGISNTVGGGDPTHRLIVESCKLFGITTDCIVSAGAAINTMILNSLFANDGDTEPTRFIKLDGAGDSGLVAGNQFATPTNANTKFVLDADVMWGANATEAGWSTARPA